jgi:enamine deaminase RidA (YjgF/YER057c/UK114 family)
MHRPAHCVLWHYVHLGQAGEDKQGKIPAGFEAEVQQALDNVGVVLQKAGMTAADADHSVVSRRVGDGHIEITVTARKSAPMTH